MKVILKSKILNILLIIGATFWFLLFFFIPNVLILLLIYLKLFLFYKINFIFIILILVIIRINNIIYFILCDFSKLNKLSYEKSLKIIKIDNNQYSYSFKETEKIQTETKLNLYIQRHVLFRETYMYLQSTINYKTNKLKPIINPFFVSTLFIINFKIICNLYSFNINPIMLLLLFIIIMFIELSNIKKDDI